MKLADNGMLLRQLTEWIWIDLKVLLSMLDFEDCILILWFIAKLRCFLGFMERNKLLEKAKRGWKDRDRERGGGWWIDGRDYG